MSARTLIVYDASYLVHVGHKSTYFESDVVQGVKLGGLIFLMEKVFAHLSSGYSVAIALDSRSDKKAEFEEYKATRIPDAEIFVQLRVAQDMCEQLGIPFFKKDGFEADDLIYEIVKANSALYNNIDVYTGDADNYGVITRKGIRCIGSGDAPTIDISNYSYAVAREEYLPHNCIIPYIAIKGKASNNIKPIKLECKANPTEIFNDFVEYCNRKEFPEKDRSDRRAITRWLIDKSRLIPKADYDTIQRRIKMVYPRPVPDVDFTIPFDCTPGINKERMIYYFQMFGMLASAMNMKVSASVNSHLQLTKEQKAQLLFYRNLGVSTDLYATGEIHPTTEDPTFTGTSVFTLGSL